MEFDDPIVGGNILIRDAIRSSNYVSGASGWTINADGSAEFSNIAIVVTGTNGLQIIRASDGTLVGSIDADGNASFESVSVNSDQLYVNGDLLSTIIARLPKGIVAWGSLSGGPFTGTAGVENPALEVAFVADASRLYEVQAQADVGSSADGSQMFIRVRDGGASAPTIASTMIQNTKLAGGQTLTFGVDVNTGLQESTFTTGQHRLLLTYGDLTAARTPVIRTAQLVVRDTGLLIPQVGVSRIAGGGGGAPVQTYTLTVPAEWSRTYFPNNSYASQYGFEAIQGNSPSGNGNLKSMIGFNTGTLGILSGSTILSCTLTMYAHHWYDNAGGTAVIGTHNIATAAATFSGTTNRVQSAGWPKPGLRTVDLGLTIGNEFRTSGLAGVTLGPGPTTGNVYYGRFDGFGYGNPPYLTFVYQK